MANRASENEGVPDRVVIAQPRPQMEANAGAEKETADAEQRQRRPMQIGDQRLDGGEAGPASGKIEADGELLQAARENQLENEEQCAAIQREAGHRQRASIAAGDDDQHHQTGNAGGNADRMADIIGQPFSKSVGMRLI